MKKENVVSFIRPNFFPGQLVDYRDFNRLSGQADRVTALLCQNLFPGGGIIEGALEGFEVVPLEGLKCLVKSGMGLSPTGEPILLTEDQILDFTPYRKSLTEPSELVVSLVNEVRGLDKMVDPDDSSISGFRSEGYETKLVCSAKQIPAGTIEVIRVCLARDTDTLRNPDREEEWNESMALGTLDRRFRRIIVPHTFAPLGAWEQVKVRTSLYGIEAALARLARIYLVEDIFGTHQYLTQLHAEVLSRPYQPLKLGFVISEFSDRLARFLDRVASHVGSSRTNFDLATLHEVVAELDSIKVKEVLPRQTPFQSIDRVALGLGRLVEFAEQKFSLVHTVREALKDIQDRLVAFEPKILLGGHLFERTDLITGMDEDRYQLKGKSEFTRSMNARFRNGDALERLGRFFKEGAVTVKLNVPDCSKPLVLLMHEYVRRGGTQVQYEVNGKVVASNLLDGNDSLNCWVNRGLAVPAEYLVPQGNELRIVVDKTDLDFGFFDVGVYAPTVFEGLGVGGEKI